MALSGWQRGEPIFGYWLFRMSFTYDFTNAPDISNVRLLVGDTDPTTPVFQDAEVMAALQAESSQGQIIGLAGYSPNPPVRQLYCYRRSAAWLLNALAANLSRLGSVISQLLDVKLAPGIASKELRSQAQALIDQEANSGQFAVSEMVQDQFSMRQRLNAMLLRQQG
jgi:hypothetical protein